MFVKPTHDHVPDPDRGGYLAADGRDVEESQYWLRRLQDGDIVQAEPPAAKPAERSPRAGRES